MYKITCKIFSFITISLFSGFEFLSEITALQWASEKGHESIVAKLVEAGANVDVQDSE